MKVILTHRMSFPNLDSMEEGNYLSRALNILCILVWDNSDLTVSLTVSMRLLLMYGSPEKRSTVHPK